VDVGERLQAEQVDVDERPRPAMDLAEGERRARDAPPVDPERLGHPLHEHGLAGAERPFQPDERAGADGAGGAPAERAHGLWAAHHPD
jgi:hypothetical protein